MKHYFQLFLLLSIFHGNAQKSFEGKIKFKTAIEFDQKVPKETEKKIREKYGDSLEVYYSKSGNFKRKYLNSGEVGLDYQLYIHETGKLLIAKKNTKIDTLNVSINSLKLVKKEKTFNEKIMNHDCECYLYKALTVPDNHQVILKYCYTNDSPKINYNFFKKHEDFFLNDFFQTSERPYLKFSLQTQAFTTTFTATELIEKEIEDDEFKVK